MTRPAAKDYLRGSLVWHRASAARGVVAGHFLQPPQSPLVGVDFGDGIILCDPLALSTEPIPEEPWQRDASQA